MNQHRKKKLGQGPKRHDDAYLQEYFEICKRIYEQMERDGTWPWTTDSTNSGDVVDSESDSDDV